MDNSDRTKRIEKILSRLKYHTDNQLKHVQNAERILREHLHKTKTKSKEIN